MVRVEGGCVTGRVIGGERMVRKGVAERVRLEVHGGKGGGEAKVRVRKG